VEPEAEFPTTLSFRAALVKGLPLHRFFIEYLLKGLEISPSGIDSNYFYGEFLIDQGEYHQARPVLERALRAPDRPDRPMADEGRRREIQAALVKLNERLED
jgi:hypothetical protein